MKNKTFGLALVAVALLPLRAFGLHHETPRYQMVSRKNPTDNAPPAATIPGLGDSSRPFSQGGLAAWCAFDSAADLKGQGAAFKGGRQVFLFDNNPDEGGRQVYQVTDEPGTSSNPSVTGTGSIVAFDSDAVLTSGNPGPVGVKQIYTWTRKTHGFSKLTNGTRDSFEPVINQRGKIITFLSKADLMENGSTGTHLFLARDSPSCTSIGCGNIVQVTPAGSSTSAHAVFSPDQAGTRVLFDTDAAIAGPATGRRQIAIFNRLTGEMTRVTNFTTGDSIKPSLGGESVNGESQRWLAFQSNADPLHNGSSGWEIFVKDMQTGDVRQVTNSPSGDSTEPSIGVNAGYVLFVSTSDVLLNGSHQRNVFLHDLRTLNTYQMTHDSLDPAHPTDSHNPIAAGDRIFFFDSTVSFAGVLNNGYRQVYSINTFQWLPGPSLGSHHFTIQPGTAIGGSKGRITTSAGEALVDLTEGEMELAFGAIATAGEAAINGPKGGMKFPPIPMAGFGALCMEPTGDASGMIDCHGGHDEPGAGLDLDVVHDRWTDDGDPFCTLGCREGETCSGPLPGGHVRPCEYCTKRCIGGPNAGVRCLDTSECGGILGGGICNGECSADSILPPGTACTATPEICNPIEACSDGLRGICVGPQVSAFSGEYTIGAARLTVPVAMKLSNSVGLDNKYCTADDTYPIQGLSTVLNLTTGASETKIIDANAIAGADLIGTEVGLPFECNQLRNGNLNGATFVGSIHLLNVPLTPAQNDLILGLSFTSGQCTINCPTACTVDTDCNDNNPCTGVETCGLNGFCRPGAPVHCDDGNACNGLEACQPATGTCSLGVAPNCDDGSLCTADSCIASVGCVNVPKNCQDGNLCNGLETCDSASGSCGPGVPPICIDTDPCNGVETCSPQFGCLSGPPISCSDGNVCNGVETCSQATGSCSGGTPLSCGDGNACNGAEYCDPVAGCQGGATPTCSDGNACNGAEVCDPGTGGCGPGPALVCDDNSPCTTDSCDVATGCVHVPLNGYKGIHCVLNMLVTELNTVAPGSTVQAKLRAKLRRMVAKVIGHVDSAERADIKYQIRHARQGVKLCNNIARSVQVGEAVGKCSGPLCAYVQDMASSAALGLQPFTVKPQI